MTRRAFWRRTPCPGHGEGLGFWRVAGWREELQCKDWHKKSSGKGPEDENGQGRQTGWIIWSSLKRGSDCMKNRGTEIQGTCWEGVGESLTTPREVLVILWIFFHCYWTQPQTSSLEKSDLIKKPILQNWTIPSPNGILSHTETGPWATSWGLRRRLGKEVKRLWMKALLWMNSSQDVAIVFSCLERLMLHALLGCQNASCFYLWAYMVIILKTKIWQQVPRCPCSEQMLQSELGLQSSPLRCKLHEEASLLPSSCLTYNLLKYVGGKSLK